MTHAVKVSEEKLTVVLGIIGGELLVEGGEGCSGVVSLDAAPVIECLYGDARNVLALRVECHRRHPIRSRFRQTETSETCLLLVFRIRPRIACRVSSRVCHTPHLPP